MSVLSFLSSTLRKTQTLRVLAIFAIFILLGSVSHYQGSFEYSIDEDGQVQSLPEDVDPHYTHHIATYEPNDIKPWNEADTLALKTPKGQEVVQILTASPFEDEETKVLKADHFRSLTQRLRVYRALWHHLRPHYNQLEEQGEQEQFYEQPPLELAPALELFQKLEQAVFPWVWKNHRTSFDLLRESRHGGRGIVMTVGNYHTIFARTAIKTLREVVRSDMPVEIYYIGEGDLSPENRAWFEKFENVKTIDIMTVIDNDLLRLGGWAIKPFAMLITKFSEVILMDSDAYFLADPAVLFEDEGYKEAGTVFFYDRTLFPGAGGDKKVWMESFLPTMSNHPRHTRWFRLKGDHEMESGVVVLDKRKHFLGLLAICKINDRYEREQVTYKKTWGDKESFWIAMEMIQEQYSFIRFGGGVIGNVGNAIPYKQALSKEEVDRYNNGEALTVTRDPADVDQVTRMDVDSGKRIDVKLDRVCGNQLHFNSKGHPLWWNSGVVRDKFTQDSPYLKYTAYMQDEHGSWDFDGSCIIQGTHGSIMELEWEQRLKAFEIIAKDKEVALELNDHRRKNILEIPKLNKADGAKGGHGNNEAV